MMPLGRFVALLRGINVSGRNRIAMAELREVCSSIGWSNIGTYIQSGNVVFTASGTTSQLETMLEKTIQHDLALQVPVIVRSATAWSKYVRSNPFPAESQAEPNRVLLALSKAPPKEDTATALLRRASTGERVVQDDDALWIYYEGGAGRSKLSPALLERTAGSPVTARNWSTVLRIEELLLA